MASMRARGHRGGKVENNSKSQPVFGGTWLHARSSDSPVIGPLGVSAKALLGVPPTLRDGAELASGLPERLWRRVEFLALTSPREQNACSVSDPKLL